MVEGLPIPQYIYHTRYGYYVSWELYGFFGTPASKEFLLDIVARFLLLFPNATRQPYAPTIKENAHINHIEPYELKYIAESLPSLPWEHKDTEVANWSDIQRKKIEQSGEHKFVSEDALFEATRHHLYRRAYAEGTGENITEDYVQVLLETENQLLLHKKDSSDVRSKAKNMSRYMQDVFVVRTDRQGYGDWEKERRNEYMRAYKAKKRKEKGLKLNKQNEIVKKIDSVLSDRSLWDRIKTKKGKWKISAIAELTELHRDTISKYLRDTPTPTPTPLKAIKAKERVFSFAEYRRKKGRD